MDYDTRECPIFGMMVYNTPCMVFSMLMFFLGIGVWILFLAGKLRTSFAVGGVYFSVTFFAAWAWAPSVKALASAGILLSLIGLYSSSKHFQTSETSRSLREATSLVIYAFVFLIFSPLDNQLHLLLLLGMLGRLFWSSGVLMFYYLLHLDGRWLGFSSSLVEKVEDLRHNHASRWLSLHEVHPKSTSVF